MFIQIDAGYASWVCGFILCFKSEQFSANTQGFFSCVLQHPILCLDHNPHIILDHLILSHRSTHALMVFSFVLLSLFSVLHDQDSKKYGSG